MLKKEQQADSETKSVGCWSPTTSLAVGALELFTVIVTFAAMNVFGTTAYSAFNLSHAEAGAVTVIISTAVPAIAGYLLARVLVREARENFFRSISWQLSPVQSVSAMLLGIGFVLAARFALTGHLALKLLWNIHDHYLGLFFALSFLGAVIMEPLAEEIYFRGILFAGLSSKFGPYMSTVLVTLIFVFAHDAPHRLIILPVSVLLGVVRLLSKSTANCFALHAAYNLGVMLWGIR